MWALRPAAHGLAQASVRSLVSASRPTSRSGAYLMMREMSAWKAVDFGMPSFGALCRGM